MDSLKKNFNTQKKISLVSQELHNLENVLEKKTDSNYKKAKEIEELHNETLKYFEEIMSNLRPSNNFK